MDQLTIPEYKLLIKAEKLKQVDKDYRNHLQAFLNFCVKAEKKAGKNKTKPIYTKFEKFYDYETAIAKTEGRVPKNRFSGISHKLLRKEGEKHG